MVLMKATELHAKKRHIYGKLYQIFAFLITNSSDNFMNLRIYEFFAKLSLFICSYVMLMLHFHVENL